MNIATDLSVDSAAKEKLLTTFASDIAGAGLAVMDRDLAKPWGAYFVIDEDQIEQFADTFFTTMRATVHQQIKRGLPLTPKFLVVAPGQPLSWQYHHRRSEIWRVISGPVGYVTSKTDELPTNVELKQAEDTITIDQGRRHRLVGQDTWGIVAEIWLHTNPHQPSDEADIVRLEDTYGRS
jgi:mannose-6-phosphate isomerase-like protein (cupin superfamily)